MEGWKKRERKGMRNVWKEIKKKKLNLYNFIVRGDSLHIFRMTGEKF